MNKTENRLNPSWRLERIDVFVPGNQSPSPVFSGEFCLHFFTSAAFGILSAIWEPLILLKIITVYQYYTLSNFQILITCFKFGFEPGSCGNTWKFPSFISQSGRKFMIRIILFALLNKLHTFSFYCDYLVLFSPFSPAVLWWRIVFLIDYHHIFNLHVSWQTQTTKPIIVKSWPVVLTI